MRKASILTIYIITLAALAVWATDVSAYSTYPSCSQCHGGFRTAPYTSLADGQSWASGLHDTHRNTMLSGDCNACHYGTGRTPVYLGMSTGGNGLTNLGCVGCHGRDGDNNGIATIGAGLRQHHFRAGETVCLDCHDDSDPGSYTPAAENVSPPYYFTPDSTHPNKPTNSCNQSGKENFAGSAQGLDNDGNGLYDGNDPACQTASCTDNDADGYGSNGASTCTKGAAIDCNDNNAAVNPGATDNTCNGIDENCSGAADEGYVPASTVCGKGICASTGQLACQAGKTVDTCTAGTLQTEGPFGSPTCSDARDNNCNGQTDALDPNCAQTCVATTEVCDGTDNDCDGQVDEGLTSTPTTCGVGSCASTGVQQCTNGKMVNTCAPKASQTEGPVGSQTCGDSLDNDCDGTTDAADASCVQGCVPTTEVCDGTDNDCDGQVDEGLTSTPTTCGVGSCASTGVQQCTNGKMVDTCAPKASQTEGPVGNQTCGDSLDNDCDGTADAADASCATTSSVCIDRDGDGYGTNGDPSCPKGTAIDCNDRKAAVNPEATEICDGKDNNCDGQKDEGVTKTFYKDADEDDYGNPAISKTACRRPEHYVTNNTDCNDSKRKIHPGAVEICDGKDNSCDGQIDEGVQKTFYLDADRDGYGNPLASIQSCRAPEGYVKNNTDCSDVSSTVHDAGTSGICNNQGGNDSDDDDDEEHD